MTASSLRRSPSQAVVLWVVRLRMTASAWWGRFHSSITVRGEAADPAEDVGFGADGAGGEAGGADAEVQAPVGAGAWVTHPHFEWSGFGHGWCCGRTELSTRPTSDSLRRRHHHASGLSEVQDMPGSLPDLTGSPAALGFFRP